MRNVVLYELMSLDGVADEPGEGEWFIDADGRLMDNLAQVISTQDTILLGRGTYEKWAPHWPTSTMQPFADFINQTPKVVFSSRTLNLQWAKTTHVSGEAADHVAELKRQEGADIGLHGSLTLARSLLNADLVDELRLVVSPALAGAGRRLFDDTGALHLFELASVDRSGGCLLLHYRRRSAAG
jgi:dihydrofolate reductase